MRQNTNTVKILAWKPLQNNSCKEKATGEIKKKNQKVVATEK